MLIRIVYFVLIGWWAAFLWGLLGYLLCLTLVLLPLGTVMLNTLPQVLTLKPVPRDPASGRTEKELPFLLRAVWFVFVGWWLGILMFKIGYILCLTIVLMPFGVWMLHRVPLALTLKQGA
jgi:uncharacterized membrane protein YccF (DUF307 family)